MRTVTAFGVQRTVFCDSADEKRRWAFGGLR